MGLGYSDLELLIRLREEGHVPTAGAVIEIGAQQLANSFLEAEGALDRARDLFHVAQPCPLPQPGSRSTGEGGAELLPEEAPLASEFWAWLGFSYSSIDIDGTPGSIPLDLNCDSVPGDTLGKYQLVTNFGTTEHVANQLNAFKIIHDLAACSGVMIHHLPMQGMLNHGLVNYNPKFFWMLARSNGYRLVYMNVTAGTSYYPLPENITASVSAFEPDIDVRRHAYRAADMGLVTVLQKVFDTPYVAPIDVQTGARTNNKLLEERYWSVFKPNAFDDLARSAPGGNDRRSGGK
jgi:hypothetical protein